MTVSSTVAISIDNEQTSHSLLLSHIELANLLQSNDHVSRIKRQTYGSSDYYNNYYNDYYKNFYANQNKQSVKVRPPPPPAPIRRPAPPANRFDNNSNRVDIAYDDYDRNDNDLLQYQQQQQQQQQLQANQQIYNGQRYTYTPIFQYKSTHGKHERLFVPNIFG